MGERSRVSPLSVRGPWRGLVTSRSPRELLPTEAAVARNVLFREGAICPRPPFEEDSFFRQPAYAGAKVYAGVDWYGIVAEGEVAHDKILHVNDRLTGRQVASISGVSARPGTFAVANGRLYYVDGMRLYVLSQNAWQIAGIEPPTVRQTTTQTAPEAGSVVWEVFNVAGYEVLPGTIEYLAALQSGSTYEFGFTFFDAYTQIESNATFSTPRSIGSIPVGTRATLQIAFGTVPPGHGVTHVRIYRRRTNASESAFVLLAQASLAQHELFRVLDYPIGYDDFGNPSPAGPFAPQKNGVLRNASVMMFYKQRMLFNDLRNPTVLRYSADQFPAHVDPSDYLTLDGTDQVTGMAELSGQAVIVKERGPWILSGPIIAPTNESIALGAGVVPSPHELYRTKERVGCANTLGGNGAVVCGRPPAVYYNAIDGLYRFDGQNAVPASGSQDNHIRPTWRLFLGRTETYGARQSLSYFVDEKRGVLYLLSQVDDDRVPILAFHYDFGSWTTIDFGTYNVLDGTSSLLNEQPTSLLQFLGSTQAATLPSGEERQINLAVATAVYRPGQSRLARVLVMTEGDASQPLPPFRYETGRMNLIDGVGKHFYGFKTFLGTIADAYVRRFRSGFRTFPRSQNVFAGSRDEYKSLDPVAAPSAYQKVSESGSDITLFWADDPAVEAKWSAAIRITGFEIDAEIVGQR